MKTGREAEAGSIAFLAISDGTTFTTFQVVVPREVAESSDCVSKGLKQLVATGSSVLVEGTLVEAPPGKEQKVELKATKIRSIGAVDAGTYPLAKKKTSMEFLREKAHLRPRTNTIGAVTRIRSQLAFATHTFFHQHGFLYVHTPIITAADCEGAGEMFQVTTLLGGVEANSASAQLSPDQLEDLRKEASLQGGKVKNAKTAAAADKTDEATAAASKLEIEKLMALKGRISQAESGPRYEGGLPRVPEGSGVDYRQDFFDKAAYLTVSGQLQAENFACALSNVYTFGPTFRAENSRTSRHLAEFWMVEPEMAYCTLADDMTCAEAYVRFCCRWLLDHCMEDLEFINKMIDKTALDRLRHVAETPFKRLSYTDAVEILEGVVRDKKKKFEFPVSWGVDLASEHERYLTEEVFKQPVIVYDYPKGIKAFYMRLNDDDKTVAAMDVLVPKVGELIGGSQREERQDVLERRIKEAGMELEPYEHYLDLRRYGSVPHAGFGLGFERLVLFATGIENIRDVIPFPRWPGNADF